MRLYHFVDVPSQRAPNVPFKHHPGGRYLRVWSKDSVKSRPVGLTGCVQVSPFYQKLDVTLTAYMVFSRMRFCRIKIP